MQDAEGQGQEAVALCGMLLKRVAPSHLIHRFMPSLLQRSGSCDTTQPFLKWLGGKRELVNREIRPLYDQVKPIGRLVEPFCGSAAVALGFTV